MSAPPLSGNGALARIARQAMIDFHLQPDFSTEAMAEVSKLDPADVPTSESAGVRDLCALPWCSIDNDDSRDLDQLSVALPTASGVDEDAKLLVAVADVDARVRRGSALDLHAQANTTSVYTPAGIFPMLPERLSTDLTSLNAGVRRLAMVVELSIAADGSVKDARVERAIVLSKAKLTYRGVSAWLEGRSAPPAPLAAVPGLMENLQLQDRIARRLETARHERGALSLETGERSPGDRIDEGDRAKSLIENLMVSANGAVARVIEARGLPSIRRVLAVPQRWDRIVALARAWSDSLPSMPDPLALERFLARQRAKAPERYPELSLAVVKLLGRGEYAVHRPGTPSPGHFGLAVQDYVHATAPNRRFADLITHRLLKAAIAGQPSPYPETELAQLAIQCNAQESNATKVERRVRKSAVALTLASRIGEYFEAVVTGASAKGVWVRTLQPFAEGKLVAGWEGLDVGDRLEVELRRADADAGLIDFVRVRTLD